MSSGLRQRIRQRLTALDLSANGASEEAGLDRGYVTELLSKPERSPRLTTLAKLAAALQCDENWLATGNGPSPDDDLIACALHELSGSLPQLDTDQLQGVLDIVRGLVAERRLATGTKRR